MAIHQSEHEKPVNLALRGKTVEELRHLALRFLGASQAEVADAQKQGLIAILSAAAAANSDLALELNKSHITIKPSFYLMVLAPESDARPTPDNAKALAQAAFDEQQARLVERDVPAQRGFRVIDLREARADTVEVEFTWQRVHWYWSPDGVALEHIYELHFGLAFLDFNSRKAMIVCHTRQERDRLVEALGAAYPVTFSPLIMTQSILEQIGSFDQVKRAGYFIADADANTPSNIVYADVNLGAKPMALAQESNPQSQRRHSFYQIPLGSIVEQGVGATSDSGKLWIPKELDLDTVKTYGSALLGRITETLDTMTGRGAYDDVLASLDISHLAKIAAITNTVLRNEVCRLTAQLVNMLSHEEAERPFTVSRTLVTKGVPGLFNYPRLQLTDSDTGDVAYWHDSASASQLVQLVEKNGALIVLGHPSEQNVDLSSTPHPLTGIPVSIDDPLAALELVPTPKLIQAVMEAIKHIANQIPELRGVVSLPFRIGAGLLRLNLDQAFGRASPSALTVELHPTDIREFQMPMRQTVPATDEGRIKKKLIELGEQCKHMSDDNCRSCIAAQRYLCLRSLVGRYLKDSLLLRHKGIELSDIQGRATVGTETVQVFGFAKLAQGNGGLTARNDNGAILLAQVMSQIDKTTFNTALIISPSTINQDLRERLQVACGVFGKRVLMLDSEVLARFLAYFEEQARFDNIDVAEIYRVSAAKTVK